MSEKRILAINPGSTSTKIGLFHDNELIFEQTLRYDTAELAPYPHIIDQFAFRMASVLQGLSEAAVELSSLDAIVGRGGLLKPIPGGVYLVNEAMCQDLRIGVQGEHASSLGGLLAKELADKVNIPAFIVDPVVVDELDDIARYSGLPELPRHSIFHALNQKAVAHRYAQDLGKEYEELNLIIAHLGGGITVGAHRLGRVVDVNNGLNGEGPFSPERAGGLASGDLMRLVLASGRGEEDWGRRLVGQGGMAAYLGTNSGREVQARITAGDQEAKFVYDAMAYQTAKEVGACAVVLQGNIDAIILTGGLAYDDYFVQQISHRISFLAPIKVYPGEDELLALAEGVLRVLKGLQVVQEYA
ncbi:MAG: butyrate kinase [Symbiobacteriaceae bacterium]|nr:butyrate kinase [Symbiobacteriaceae bacterium]